MLLSLFLLVYCKENKSSKDQTAVVSPEQIQSVKVMSAGGELGFSSSTSINKDSIHYSRTVAANEADNLVYSKKMKSGDWKNLIDKVDMKLFGAAKEEQSVQPVDGIDRKIIVTTNAGEISKMNAYNDPAWKKILDGIDQYNQKYK